MVVSAQPLASRVGAEILAAGGNAVDAAVAIGFALAVVHPTAGNLGGGGFMVISLPEAGGDFTLDFRETAPAQAQRDMYLDPSGEVVPGLSTASHLASGVPGSVAGLHSAWRRWGAMRWESLVEPAIRLAEDGFTVSDGLARSLRSAAELLSRHPESRRIFLASGVFLQPGDRLVQPELASTLRRIAAAGPDGFYRGETARLIEEEMGRGKGLITRKDLEDYQPVIRPPVASTYRGLEIVSMGPPSSGGVLLAQLLNMLEGFPLGGLGFGSSADLHLKAELMKRAFADRAAYLGDPDFSVLPVELLLSRDYARRRAEGLRMDLASASVGPGLGPEAEETTHYSVMDRDRRAVAVTTTINGGYGSGITVTGAGFLLNNEMDDFTVRRGTPNMFGLIQSGRNLIEPGKRPLSAMTPTIVKRDGIPYLVLGSPGGPTIISTVFQVLTNVVDHGMNLQAAVDATRIHHQWVPDEIVHERNGLVADVEVALRSRGHRLRERPRIGEAQCIEYDVESGRFRGAADPRGEGSAVGVSSVKPSGGWTRLDSPVEVSPKVPASAISSDPAPRP